jgi:tocopherol O-methyltransferase
MQPNTYHKNIQAYYASTKNSYIDSWAMHKVHALHYGYTDATVKNFEASLLKMNEVLMLAAQIKPTDLVLDAGCGVGGSSIYLAKTLGCTCVGITLSPTQIPYANQYAQQAGVQNLVSFYQMHYQHTTFAPESFDVVWGNESICYADDKSAFVQEAYRLLKPGGRLILGEGFVTKPENNQIPSVRKMLNGWQINYLSTPQQFLSYMQSAGFKTQKFTNITKNVMPSALRLLVISVLATFYGWYKTLIGKNNWSPIQKANIKTVWHQYFTLKRQQWVYGIVLGQK